LTDPRHHQLKEKLHAARSVTPELEWQPCPEWQMVLESKERAKFFEARPNFAERIRSVLAKGGTCHYPANLWDFYVLFFFLGQWRSDVFLEVTARPRWQALKNFLAKSAWHGPKCSAVWANC
jgi:hypothetical protein